MNAMKKTMFALAGISVLTLAASTLVGRAAPAGGCRTPSAPASVGRTSPVALGRGLAAAASGGVVTIADDGAVRRFVLPEARPGDVARHVAARAGFGTAFVLDRPGSDILVIDTPTGTIELPQPGEALHPAWSPDGDLVWSLGSSLRLRSHLDGAQRRIDTPRPGGYLFSPVFATTRRIVVVASAPPSPAVPEGDALDNLWSVDLPTGRWSPVTHFTAGADRWSAIRTPVVVGPGLVEFVRVAGSGSATSLPSFSLWRLRDSAVMRIRTLPGEWYLASSDGTTRVWNVPDRRSGEWRLVREDGSGRLRDLGCGAVMVDPLDKPDPDKQPLAADAQPPDSPTATATPTGSDEDVEIAILVGDFGSPEAAEAAAGQIRGAYGPDAPVEVVDSTTAPGTVQPGVWAAILRLPAGADPGQALADFRGRLPGYEGWSWVVTP